MVLADILVLVLRVEGELLQRWLMKMYFDLNIYYWQYYNLFGVEMGGNESQTQKIRQRHEKFIKVFRNNYKLKEEINDEVFGVVLLFYNKNTNHVQIMEKCLAFESEEDVDKIIKTMEKRVSKPTPNLLRIYSIQHNEDNELCGTSKFVKVYTEYLHKNLKNQLRKRRKNGAYLSEQLLLKITISLLNGIKYLHDENVFHGEIRTENILVDGSFHLKLTQRSLLCPSNWEVDLRNGINLKILKGKGALLSPCILDCIENQRTQLVEYNPFKADIFALGMILLQCCSLKKAQGFYDYEGARVKFKEISMVLYQCRKKYTANLMNIIDKMLEFDDENRPSAGQLMSKMEKISGDTIREMNTTLNESFMSESIRSYM